MGEPRKRIDTVIGSVAVVPECKVQATCTNGSKCWEAGECLRAPCDAGSEGKEKTCCAGCGDADPAHWREDGWYCEGCASCEVCQSPYCENPEHVQ